jgi:hypothetical protein
METSKSNNLEQFASQMKEKIGQIHTFHEFDAANPDYRQECFNTQVTRDSIRHFVDGIGDINPLFRDRNYAFKTKYGRITAPPTFLETINYSQHPEGVPPGIEGFLSGLDWEYLRPVFEGDEYAARVIYPFDVQVKPSQFAGRLVIITEKGNLMGLGGNTVATYKSWVIFMEGSRSKERRTSQALNEMPKYSKQEIDEIYLAQDKETMADRGIPRIHDAGAQRNAWRNMVLTNWIGDEGFLWKSRAEVRGFNQEGDVTWCKAKVIKKYVQKGRYCADINCWCENQRHEVTMPGEGTVILPSREHGSVIYPDPE